MGRDEDEIPESVRSPTRMDELDDDPSPTWCTPDIIQYTERLTHEPKGLLFRRFISLQIRSIVYMQKELAKIEADNIHLEKGDRHDNHKHTTELLHHYVQAIEDLEYVRNRRVGFKAKETRNDQLMQEAAYDLPMVQAYDTSSMEFPTLVGYAHDGFHTLKKMARRILCLKGTKWAVHSEEGGESGAQGRCHHKHVWLEHLANYGIACLHGILGGGSLIGPVILMTIKPSLEKSLLVTSISTILFAFGSTYFDRKNAMLLTTTYAAVLVVFVGTNDPPCVCIAP